jgi:hypothetical protein
MPKPNSCRTAARRLLTLTVASATAIAFCATVAEPAQASSAKCQEYLRSRQIYQIGPKVIAACNAGQSGGGGTLACYVSLLAIQVTANDAAIACNAADD